MSAATEPPRTGLQASLILGGLAAGVAALYLNNPSLRDALLYPLLAIIGAPPTIFLVRRRQ